MGREGFLSYSVLLLLTLDEATTFICLFVFGKRHYKGYFKIWLHSLTEVSLLLMRR